MLFHALFIYKMRGIEFSQQNFTINSCTSCNPVRVADLFLSQKPIKIPKGSEALTVFTMCIEITRRSKRPSLYSRLDSF